MLASFLITLFQGGSSSRIEYQRIRVMKEGNMSLIILKAKHLNVKKKINRLMH